MTQARPSIITWILAGLGALLIISPWIFQFADDAAAVDWSVLEGIAIVVTALLTWLAASRWPQWWSSFAMLNMLWGVAAAINPGLFKFGDMASWVSALIGLAVIVGSFIESWRDSSAGSASGPVVQ
jgi:hypothetical protein